MRCMRVRPKSVKNGWAWMLLVRVRIRSASRHRLMPSSVATQIARLQQGDHICFYYESAADQWTAVGAYIRQGLRRRERCLYIADDRNADEVVAGLIRARIDVERERKRGSLVLLTASEAHIKNGRFNAEAMLRLLNDAVEQALDDGFTGLRAAGEMTWMLLKAPGTHQAMAYEALMNEFYPKNRALGLCLYDRSRFDGTILCDSLRTHPRIMSSSAGLAANPFYEPPAVFLNAHIHRVRFDHQIAQIADASRRSQRGTRRTKSVRRRVAVRRRR